jgi:hypothetical protein
MPVKVETPNLERTIKNLAKFDNVVMNVTRRLKKLVTQNWDKGKGADGGKFKELTEDYKNQKSKQGRQAIRDLLLKGKMRVNLMPVKENVNHYKLTFIGASEVKKARGNAKHAPNMMIPVSDRINAKLQKLAFKLYKKEK